MASHSWSTVKLDLYGLKFFYAHVLRQPWVTPGLIKPSKSVRLPGLLHGAFATLVVNRRIADDRAPHPISRSPRKIR